MASSTTESAVFLTEPSESPSKTSKRSSTKSTLGSKESILFVFYNID